MFLQIAARFYGVGNKGRLLLIYIVTINNSKLNLYKKIGKKALKIKKYSFSAIYLNVA